MDPEALVRRYLEQRREFGERELILDTLSAVEALRLLEGRAGRSLAGTAAQAAVDWRDVLAARGAGRGRERGSSGSPPVGERPRRGTEGGEGGEGGEWTGEARGSRRAVGGEGGAGDPSSRARRTQGPGEPEEAGAAGGGGGGGGGQGARGVTPSGLVVGSGERELFMGPVGECRTLDELAEMIRRCRRCDLYRTARNAVPGEGNPQAKLMCVGEAPGASEDETGRPFVGQAGQLLTKILAAIKLSRDEVFIANVLKHRPPGNRNPQPEEVEACRPYLVRQVELIRPKVIIAFGTFAAQTLLETKLPIGKLRGAIHRYHGIPVIVTYHPAALLRNPAWKRPTWEDVQLARRLLDSTNP